MVPQDDTNTTKNKKLQIRNSPPETEQMQKTVGDQFFDLILDAYLNVMDRVTKEMRHTVPGMTDQLAHDIKVRWHNAVVKKIGKQREKAMRSLRK